MKVLETSVVFIDLTGSSSHIFPSKCLLKYRGQKRIFLILSVLTGYKNYACSRFRLVQHEQNWLCRIHLHQVFSSCFSYLNIACFKQPTYYSLPVDSTITPFKHSIGPSEHPSCCLNVRAQTCLSCETENYLFQHGSLRHMFEFWLNS